MLYCSPEDLEVLSTPEGIGFYSPATGDRWLWEAAPSATVARVLSELRRPREEQDIRQFVESQTPDGSALVDALIGHELLKPFDPDGRTETSLGWADRGWSDAARLHMHVQSLANFDYSDPHGYRNDFRQMAEQVAQEGVPESFKSYDSAGSIALTRRETRLGSSGVNPGSTELQMNWTVDYLSDFLRLVVGRTGWKKLAASGQHFTRTSPSGGARQPTEAYLLVADVAGMERGAYHYSVEHHRLELLATDFDVEDFIRRNVIVMPHRGPKFLAFSMVYTTIFERSMHRYRESRSYRVMHFDIGHLFGTAHLLLDSTSAPYFSGYAVREEPVARLLGLDVLMESPMAHTTVGRGDMHGQ